MKTTYGRFIRHGVCECGCYRNMHFKERFFMSHTLCSKCGESYAYCDVVVRRLVTVKTGKWWEYWKKESHWENKEQ